MRERAAATGLWLCLIALPFAWVTPADAHKLSVFARVEGTTIYGLAYFAGRSPAQGIAVEAFGPDGTLLATTTTGADGRFAVPAQARITYRIVVNGGDGHAGEYTVRASELPPSLPGAPPIPGPRPPVPECGTAGRNGGPCTADTAPAPVLPTPVLPTPVTAAAPAASAPAASARDDADGGALEAALDRVLARQLAPLREQLAEAREEVLWRDVLGGLGYVLGLTGIACWFMARRRVPSVTVLERRNETL